MENLVEVKIDNAAIQNLINSYDYSQLGSHINPSMAVFGWFAGFFAGGMVWTYLAIFVLYIVAMWIVFQKAQKPGWAILIPFYNTIVYLNIIGRPWWWLLLLFVPIVNVVIGVIITHDLSLAFKRDAWFTVGLLFLPWIFAPILAFGKDKYAKPKH